jgi:hypothetical protein
LPEGWTVDGAAVGLAVGSAGGAVDLANFDYIKLGPYDPARGGLDSPTTNQRFYRVEGGKLVDATSLFRKKPLN